VQQAGLLLLGGNPSRPNAQWPIGCSRSMITISPACEPPHACARLRSTTKREMMSSFDQNCGLGPDESSFDCVAHHSSLAPSIDCLLYFVLVKFYRLLRDPELQGYFLVEKIIRE